MTEDDLVRLEQLLGLCEVQNVRSGVPLPLGAHARGGGVNFALFSRNASGVRLDLFDRVDDATPSRTIILDTSRNKTGDIWHVWLDGIRSGQLYGFRVAGPYDPDAGHRFNPSKLVVDPYASAIALVPGHDFRTALGYDPRAPGVDLSISETDDAGTAPKSVVAHADFDWHGDQPLRQPWSSTVIYELHVRGFTAAPSSGVRFPGTYSGLVEKIPYLQELGVTAVQLMPIAEFNELACGRMNPLTGERLTNFWGYDPIAFFAPRAAYASVREPGAHILEFKEMVRALHAAGIEVILDVVFNHTVEGSELGPTVCFRGLDNAIYYWLAEDKRYYRDFTGTGQTINAAHPIVRDMILDALRFWVIEMHVDGFRFDLASVLGRDAGGVVVADAPLLARIAEDPILRDAKLIAEAWDAAGAYQLGTFSERRWAEWNGRFRDDVRRFWRGDPGMAGAFATRIAGSSDLYLRSKKGPECSINYVTCHDGFTLNDLVSFERKHNDANGEGNRDGADENYSSGYSAEGPTDDRELEALRARQIKNFLVTLAISRGVPMLLAGDEFRRTQRGNNNAYCQDNETSWVDWSLRDLEANIFRFARGVLAFRHTHRVLRQDAFYDERDLTWFAPTGSPPDWLAPESRCVACLVHAADAPPLYLMFNAAATPVAFVLPPGEWSLAIDTAAVPPGDLIDERERVPLPNATRYEVSGRACVVLVDYGANARTASARVG